MEYTQLGDSELQVSRICLGCMGFGDSSNGQHSWTLDEAASREIIAHALDRGINFFDTAITYQNGSSERYVGRALRDFAERDQYVIATKFLPRTDQELADGVTGQQHVLNNLDVSFANLGLDYVDLYICHMWDYRTPIEELLDGLNQAVQAGKVRAIGISNCYAWQLAKANALAEREGWTKFVSIQGHYNLIFREEEREMAGLCQADHIALTPYSALAAGRLARRPGENTRRLEQDAVAKSKYDAASATVSAQDQVIIERVAKVADRHQVSMTEVALAWLLTKVTAPIVGATKVAQVDDAVKAVELELSVEEVAYLEEPYVPHQLVGVMALNQPGREWK